MRARVRNRGGDDRAVAVHARRVTVDRRITDVVAPVLRRDDPDPPPSEVEKMDAARLKPRQNRAVGRCTLDLE